MATCLHDGGRTALAAGIGGPSTERAELADSAGATEVEVTTAGKVRLEFNTTDALTIWIDGKPVAPAAELPRSIVVDLARGRHTLTVAVDLARRRDGIRCVLADVADSPCAGPARARKVKYGPYTTRRIAAAMPSGL